jgi:hypothetical protein
MWSLFWPTTMIRPKSQNFKLGHDGILSIGTRGNTEFPIFFYLSYFSCDANQIFELCVEIRMGGRMSNFKILSMRCIKLAWKTTQGKILYHNGDGAWQTEFFSLKSCFLAIKQSWNMKISNIFFSFFPSRNQYFPHIPYVASKNRLSL